MIRALKNRVVLRGLKDQEMTPGGLHVPETSQMKQARGEVLSVGRDVQGIAVGDTVAFEMFAPETVHYCGEEYLIIHWNEIHGVLE